MEELSAYPQHDQGMQGSVELFPLRSIRKDKLAKLSTINLPCACTTASFIYLTAWTVTLCTCTVYAMSCFNAGLATLPELCSTS